MNLILQKKIYVRIYLDYNATTPLEAEVIHAVTESLTDAWGNPSSSHDAGSILGNFSGLSSS